MDIGERIQKLRQARGMTQEQFAAAMEVSVQTVSRWENRVTLPDISLLPKIAVFFNTTADYLLGMNDLEHQPKLLRTVERFQVTSKKDAEAMVDVFRSESFPKLADWKITEEDGACILEVTKDFNVELDRLSFGK